MPDQGADLDRVIHKAETDNRLMAVVLFGSRARGEPLTASDVDLCLVLDPKRADADTVAGVRLEYLVDTPACFDIQVYQGLPIYVRRRVLAEGKVLFCRDEDALYDIAYRTIQAFEDFRPRYQQYLDEVASAGS
jgi:predicted nucleotidyltransferase